MLELLLLELSNLLVEVLFELLVLLDLIRQRQHLSLLLQQRFVFVLQISFDLAQSFLQLLDLRLRRSLGFLLA